MPQVRAIPQGREHPIPHLIVPNGAEAIRFYERAFGAEATQAVKTPDGKLLHAELKLGSSVLYLAEDMPEMCGGKARTPQALGGSPVNIHRYVTDVDAAMKRAAEAGATVIMPAMDMFWGDRYGQIVDPFGHVWSLATHIADPSPDEVAQAAEKICREASATPPKAGKL